MTEQDFLNVINEHRGIIHKICCLYRNTAEDREDLFQEIVFQLWKGIGTFKGEAKITTWMYRVALNTAIASFKKKKPVIDYAPILPDMVEEQPDDETAIRRERLFAAMNQLDDAEKAIIALYLEDFSYQQIAEITGISENYTGVKLNRIKNKLQKLLNI